MVHSHFLRHPAALYKSVLYSLRYRKLVPMITASGRTTIRTARDSSIVLGGKLVLGYMSSQVGDIGQPDIDHTVLQLAEGAVFTTDGRVDIGPGVRLILGRGATVSIGHRTFITANSKIIAKQRVCIGADCAISWGVQIIDSDFHWIDKDNRPNTLPVTIEDHCWIGTGATILKGVVIGEGAVVAAGAVVTRSVAPRTLVAGNPAVVVKENVAWVR